MGLNPILNLSILTMYEWWIKRWKSVLSSNVAWSKSLQFNSPAALKLIDGFPADIPSTATIQIGCFMPTNNVKRWIVEEKRCIVLVLRWICGAEHKRRRKMMRTGRSWRWDNQQLREKHPKMDAPNYVRWLSIKVHCSVTKSYVPQNTVLHQLASNWLSKPIITKAVMIHHKSRWSLGQLQLLNLNVVVLVRLVLEQL